MPTYDAPQFLSDLLLIEVHPGWSRDTAPFAAGAMVPRGSVLALVAGKYQAVNPAGSGDAKKSRAVAIETVDATASDKNGVVIARGAVVNPDALIWPDGTTDAQKTTALAELEARGIKVNVEK
jgi:hypothetical protein